MRVCLTGGTGQVGKAILDVAPQEAPHHEMLAPTRQEMNLFDPESIKAWFKANKVDCVIHSAAKVRGIAANVADPVGFLHENTLINMFLIKAAQEAGVPKMIFISSSCTYPKDFPEILKEEHILAAPLEPTNEGYALAKIVGQKLCSYCNSQYGTQYRTFLPCNLYGIYDHFEPVYSHLVAAAISKTYDAMRDGKKTISVWGDGTVKREFLYAEDFARFIMQSIDKLDVMPDYLNVGYGTDHTVMQYYEMVAEALGYEGGYELDRSKPLGMLRKLMDSSKAQSFGWKPMTDIRVGIQRTAEFYRANIGPNT